MAASRVFQGHNRNSENEFSGDLEIATDLEFTTWAAGRKTWPLDESH